MMLVEEAYTTVPLALVSLLRVIVEEVLGGKIYNLHQGKATVNERYSRGNRGGRRKRKA